jgi:hypothetical protein
VTIRYNVVCKDPKRSLSSFFRGENAIEVKYCMKAELPATVKGREGYGKRN